MSNSFVLAFNAGLRLEVEHRFTLLYVCYCRCCFCCFVYFFVWIL